MTKILKIKETKWEEFKNNSENLGFKLDEDGTVYYKRFHNNIDTPNDYMDLQIWVDDKSITFETNCYRYSGICTNGEEIHIIYNLIMNGYVEEIIKE